MMTVSALAGQVHDEPHETAVDPHVSGNCLRKPSLGTRLALMVLIRGGSRGGRRGSLASRGPVRAAERQSSSLSPVDPPQSCAACRGHRETSRDDAIRCRAFATTNLCLRGDNQSTVAEYLQSRKVPCLLVTGTPRMDFLPGFRWHRDLQTSAGSRARGSGDSGVWRSPQPGQPVIVNEQDATSAIIRQAIQDRPCLSHMGFRVCFVPHALGRAIRTAGST